MAVLAKPTKYATKNVGESLTEREHKDSCDINKMIHAAARGQHVRGGKAVQYGTDDLNTSLMDVKIQKDRIERELEKQFSETEFSEEEAEAIPPSVRKKYEGKIKIRKKEQNQNDQTKHNAQNAQKNMPDNNEQSSNSSGDSNLSAEKQPQGRKS